MLSTSNAAAAASSASMLMSESGPSSESGMTLFFFHGRPLAVAVLVFARSRFVAERDGIGSENLSPLFEARLLRRTGGKLDSLHDALPNSSFWSRRATLASGKSSEKSSSFASESSTVYSFLAFGVREYLLFFNARSLSCCASDGKCTSIEVDTFESKGVGTLLVAGVE